MAILPGIPCFDIPICLPLYYTFSMAFKGGPGAFVSVFKSAYTYRLLRFTLIESLLSALISVAVALPFAAFFAHYSFRFRKLVLSLSALSFTIPSILVVLGFVIFYGNNGVLNTLLKSLFGLDESPIRILYTFGAVILAHVYLNIPIAFCLITNSWEHLSREEERASYTLRVSKTATFFKITLFRLKAVIFGSFALIFLFCFSSFSIVMVLGGNPEYSTLETEIYRRAHISLNYSEASALSVFSFIITTLFLLLSFAGKRKEIADKGKSRIRKIENKKMKALAFFLTVLMLLFILPPLLSIFYRSISDRNGVFSLSSYTLVFSTPSFLSSILNSLFIATVSAAVAAVLAEGISMYAVKTNSRLAPLFATLPLATGSVTLGLGYNYLSAHLAHSARALDYALVIATHLVLTIPFALRTMLPGAKEIPQLIANASYTLRKGSFETYWRVEHPMLKSYRRKAFIFSFALSLGEVNATLSLAGGRITTLPILIYRKIGSYDYRASSALGSILLALAFIVFIFSQAKGRKNGIS